MKFSDMVGMVAKDVQSLRRGNYVKKTKKANGLMSRNITLKCWIALKILKLKGDHFSFYNCCFIIIKTPIYEIKAYRLEKSWVGEKLKGLSSSAG